MSLIDCHILYSSDLSLRLRADDTSYKVILLTIFLYPVQADLRISLNSDIGFIISQLFV